MHELDADIRGRPEMFVDHGYGTETWPWWYAALEIKLKARSRNEVILQHIIT
jgi:hypothetical protein